MAAYVTMLQGWHDFRTTWPPAATKTSRRNERNVMVPLRWRHLLRLSITFYAAFFGVPPRPYAQNPPFHLYCHPNANVSPLQHQFQPTPKLHRFDSNFNPTFYLHQFTSIFTPTPMLHRFTSNITPRQLSTASPPMSTYTYVPLLLRTCNFKPNLNSTASRYLLRHSYTQTPPFLVGVGLNVRYRRNDWYWVYFNNILEHIQCYTVKTQQRYCNLLLQGYMFRFRRVIIRTSNELTQDYLIPSALWDPVALTVCGVIVL